MVKRQAVMPEVGEMTQVMPSAKRTAAAGSKRPDPVKPKAGRTTAPEKYTKATVPLFNRQIAALDEIRAAIKRRTGASVMRAEIIRAALDAILEAKIDLSAVRPEPEFKNADLKRIITAQVRAKGNGR